MRLANNLSNVTFSFSRLERTSKIKKHILEEKTSIMNKIYGYREELMITLSTKTSRKHSMDINENLDRNRHAFANNKSHEIKENLSL